VVKVNQNLKREVAFYKVCKKRCTFTLQYCPGRAPPDVHPSLPLHMYMFTAVHHVSSDEITNPKSKTSKCLELARNPTE